MKVDLELRREHRKVVVDDEVNIPLYATSDSEDGQLIAAMDVIFTWDPEHLRLIDVDDRGAPDWAESGFLLDPFFINEVSPPEDGNGLYTAWGKGGKTVQVTPEGTLITTFVFKAIRPTHGRTRVGFIRKLQLPDRPMGRTEVYDGTVPGKNVLGDTGRRVVIKVRRGLQEALGLDDDDDDGEN